MAPERERVRGNHLVEVTNASSLRRERCAQPPVFVSRLRIPSFSPGSRQERIDDLSESSGV